MPKPTTLVISASTLCSDRPCSTSLPHVRQPFKFQAALAGENPSTPGQLVLSPGVSNLGGAALSLGSGEVPRAGVSGLRSARELRIDLGIHLGMLGCLREHRCFLS